MIRDAAVPVLLVTHDFAEAALLADRIAVMDGGRVLQEGTASALAAAPASAFVADFSGAVVLTGEARRGERGRRRVVALDGGGEVTALEGEPGRSRSASTRGRSRSRGPARRRTTRRATTSRSTWSR